MDGYTIAEAADLAGIPATTLRYYEDEGVIASPARAENGYRQYAERDVDRLRFLGRARRLDLSPGDLKELAQAWDTDSCASVQHGLSRIVGTRLAEAQCQVADLVEHSAELQRVAARLTRAPKEGPCDEQCACSPAGEQIPVQPATSLPLTLAGSPAISCTLAPEAVGQRVDDWRGVLEHVRLRQSIEGGLALTFATDPAIVTALAQLATAEQGCCAFFDFRLHFAGDVVEFEVRTPQEARELAVALFGEATAEGGQA